MNDPNVTIKILSDALRDIANEVGAVSHSLQNYALRALALAAKIHVEPTARLITDEERQRLAVLLDAMAEANGPTVQALAAQLGLELKTPPVWDLDHHPESDTEKTVRVSRHGRQHEVALIGVEVRGAGSIGNDYHGATEFRVRLVTVDRVSEPRVATDSEIVPQIHQSGVVVLNATAPHDVQQGDRIRFRAQTTGGEAEFWGRSLETAAAGSLIQLEVVLDQYLPLQLAQDVLAASGDRTTASLADAAMRCERMGCGLRRDEHVSPLVEGERFKSCPGFFLGPPT